MRNFGMVLVVGVLLVVGNVALAGFVDDIGMDFVTIGNPGNPGDTRAEANPSGCGAVGYEYQIGKYEITNAQWDAFVAATGAPTGNPSNAYDESATYTGTQQPTNKVSWYEAAQFCNYLTSGDKSLGAYHLGSDGSITIDRAAAIAAYGTAYVIPTENEWYKAAYYKPNGSGYSTYANGQDTIPTADNGWNYAYGSYSTPWDVGIGTEEQNGTFDMMGNLFEWNDELISASSPYSYGVRGGSAYGNLNELASTFFHDLPSNHESIETGLRIVSVPEPATLLLLGLGAVMVRKKANYFIGKKK